MPASLLAVGALAVLALSGAALVLAMRRSMEPAPGSDAWFAKQGIIPLITDANRARLEAQKPQLTSGPFGDVVGYFLPSTSEGSPAVMPRLALPPVPDPTLPPRQIQADRSPFDASGGGTRE